jgi:hypothetical protein
VGGGFGSYAAAGFIVLAGVLAVAALIELAKGGGGDF